MRDLRISVELIVRLLAQGMSVEEILDDYPALEPDDVRACLPYAHAMIAHDRGWRETMAIQLDPESLAEIRHGLAALDEGAADLYTLGELFDG